MAERIKRRPDQLRDQLATAEAGIIAAGAAWPANAPTAAQTATAKGNIGTRITNATTIGASLKVAQKATLTARDEGFDVMKKIDETTDSLYGPDGPEKANFGLTPKGGTGGGPAPLVKLTDIRIFDGPTPGSFKFDWETIEGATYEVKWYSNATMTQLVGSATATASEYLISGLTPGQQYWMIVRAVRASTQGPWSDPATRVANV